MNQSKKQALRARIEYEDSLLNSRTGIFLTANGLFGVAINLKEEWTLILFALGISILWFVVGRKQHRIIKGLTVALLGQLKDSDEDFVENIVQDESDTNLFLRPTNILCLWLPSLAVLAWIYLGYRAI